MHDFEANEVDIHDLNLIEESKQPSNNHQAHDGHALTLTQQLQLEELGEIIPTPHGDHGAKEESPRIPTSTDKEFQEEIDFEKFM